MVQGIEVRFISCQPEDIWGTETAWITPQRSIPVSDIERTIVDCLETPRHCGGYADIDKGAWMVRHKVDADRLVDYAVKLASGVVFRRLGFLLESCGIGLPRHVEDLRGRLTDAYEVLDPTLPEEGRFTSRWRLQVNVPPEELTMIRGT
jgi:predicted transcriptional regulator of viral defense system